jgi:hypothetical protein
VTDTAATTEAPLLARQSAIAQIPGVSATWIVERTLSRRFPFRVSIEQDGRLILAVRAQARWPGPGQQIFCLQERDLDLTEPLDPVERVPVAHLGKVGRKLTVALDRPNRKRCEFLTVLKERRDGSGTYEQVFFRTETGIRAHRSRTRVELARPAPALRVAIDSNERYPWRFGGAAAERRKLAVGDYALLDGERVVAVVERKTFDNLLGDIGALQALHQQLADLASHEAAALVIEAQYADFLDDRRLAGRWPASHVARVLAEIGTLHPTLPVIFAGNRKLANIWTQRFFEAVAARQAAPTPQLHLDVEARYDAFPRAPGLDDAIRTAAMQELPDPFTFRELADRFSDTPPTRLRRVLGLLKREGRIERIGAGRGARWRRMGE